MTIHVSTCLCFKCLRRCVTVYNPRWISLLPNKVNEILVGPITPLKADRILQVKGGIQQSFQILDKYVYSHSLCHMITLHVITPTDYIITPGELLTYLCPITSKQIMDLKKEEENVNGKNINTLDSITKT